MMSRNRSGNVLRYKFGEHDLKLSANNIPKAQFVLTFQT